MAGPKPTTVDVTPEERVEVERLVRAHGTAQQVALRAQIILLASAGVSTVEISARVGLSRKAVRLWRDRWASLAGIPLKDLSITAPAAGSSAKVCVQIPPTTPPPGVHTPAGRWNSCSGFAMLPVLSQVTLGHRCSGAAIPPLSLSDTHSGPQGGGRIHAA